MESDSGYEGSPVPPGEVATKEFEFQGKELFVTYSRSRVGAKEEFHRLLLASLEDVMPKLGVKGQRCTVEVYGCREEHEDGTPHYDVLLSFDHRVHWRKARRSLQVWIDVDGHREVDTESIFIRKRPRRQTRGYFLDCVQAYIAKEGDVFGQWIHRGLGRSEKEELWQSIVAEPSAEKARGLLREHFPRTFAISHGSVLSFLREKEQAPVPVHVPDFTPGRWKVPAKMLKWRKDNFPVVSGGRPQLLIVQGPPRCGKTEWALSFGRPVQMTGSWNMDELLRRDFTHVVLNDIHLKTFRYKREMAGCQSFFTATGKYREERTVKLGVPVIWTCNSDNSPVHDVEMKEYIRQSGKSVVYVKIRPGRKLFESVINLHKDHDKSANRAKTQYTTYYTTPHRAGVHPIEYSHLHPMTTLYEVAVPRPTIDLSPSSPATQTQDNVQPHPW